MTADEGLKAGLHHAEPCYYSQYWTEMRVLPRQWISWLKVFIVIGHSPCPLIRVNNGNLECLAKECLWPYPGLSLGQTHLEKI